MFVNAREKEIYERGYRAGCAEGLKKASLLIRLMASGSEEFEEEILQNSREAAELRKLMTAQKKMSLHFRVAGPKQHKQCITMLILA